MGAKRSADANASSANPPPAGKRVAYTRTPGTIDGAPVAPDMPVMAMAREIAREDVRRLLDEGAQLVDVLPAADYEREHIAGAVGIPLARLGREATSRLPRDRAVIVYCHDYQ